MADAIAEEFRAYDGLGRFGGDEFVLVLPGVDTEGATEAAHRLRHSVDRALRDEALSEVTASVGVARWREPLTSGELLDGRTARCWWPSAGQGPGRGGEPADRGRPGPPGRRGQRAVGLLADLWDMVSQCEHPREVLTRLPALLTESLRLADCVLVHPKLLGDPRAPAPGRRRDRPHVAARAARGPGPDRAAAAAEITGAHAAVALQHDGELHGLLIMRSDESPFPLASLRLAELISGQAVTALIGQVGGARAPRSARWPPPSTRATTTPTCTPSRWWPWPPASPGAWACPSARSSSSATPRCCTTWERWRSQTDPLQARPLDDEEWAVMREHPVIGERIILRTPELVAIAPIVRHEHSAGTGTDIRTG